jgi:Mago binding protein
MRPSQLAAVLGAVMLVGFTADPALAQVPGGSYLESCANVHGFGDRLIADCRRADGSWRRAVLPDVGSCVGDISNQNGHLRCDRGGPAYGGPPYGGYGYHPYAPPEAAPGYGYPYGYR